MAHNSRGVQQRLQRLLATLADEEVAAGVEAAGRLGINAFVVPVTPDSAGTAPTMYAVRLARQGMAHLPVGFNFLDGLRTALALSNGPILVSRQDGLPAPKLAGRCCLPISAACPSWRCGT